MNRSGHFFKQPSILPGFGLTLGLSLTYLSLVVLIPLALLVIKPWHAGIGAVLHAVMTLRVLSALELSFGAALIAAAINALFGLLVAWVLVRYDFPLKRIADAAVDLPFALPTAVAGIALTAIYAPNGWIGSLFAAQGLKLAFTETGIVIALTFVSLPFVVRTVQPVLADIDAELEEAAASLGASRIQVFFRVILPVTLPALLTGFALAFARATGEYGSVIFIAGNRPFRTEIAPLLIVTKLEQFDIDGAAAIATVMLIVSFLMLLVINFLQQWTRRWAAS